MITVINHELGNIGSVVRALNFLNIDFIVSADYGEIAKATKIILPGVGSYKAASEQLLTSQFVDIIQNKVLGQKTPFFGFCLGMQLLTEFGTEMGHSKGLGLIKGKTQKIEIDQNKYKLPHMGWNDVSSNGLKMFQGLKSNACFYFVHSFEVIIEDPNVKIANVNYGDKNICAAIEKGNIWGAQFHPEKSQKYGLQVLKNFCEV